MTTDLNRLLNAIGLDENADDQEVLDKVADHFTTMLNSIYPPTEQGCVWKMKYEDYGEFIRASKIKDDKEVAWMRVHCDSCKVEQSSDNDPDIIALRNALIYAILQR